MLVSRLFIHCACLLCKRHHPPFVSLPLSLPELPGEAGATAQVVLLQRELAQAHAQLAANRSCLVEHDCVWSKTGQQLDFAEADEAEISTLSDFKDADMHSKSRRSSRHYGVRTISLNDMLEKHSAPRDIDYLSIDTEGSELEILSSLDFNKYQFKAITCEHNHTASRALIHDLLSGAGYVRKFTELSDFDDWYVKR